MPRIHFPKSKGIASRQAHADLPANTFERELGREGFYGAASQLHQRHAHTGWTEIEGSLQPHAFDTTHLQEIQEHPWHATELLHNAHVRIRFWLTNHSMRQLARNADGDDLLFVHAGQGELFCDYGHLSFREGDYLLIPRGTLWRMETCAPLKVLMIESTGTAFGLPEKGLIGQQAIFDPAMLDTPELDAAYLAQQNEEPTDVLVKRHQQITRIQYPFNPLDTIGWHGDLCLVRINWRDIRPLMSHRYHVPPSAHTTFVTDRFVVCTFCPRPMETDPGALKVPFYHNNDDYDEVLFYHSGEFFSRDNMHAGMMSLHPCGITHGPHPKAYATGQSAQRKETNEVAVMIDTRDALLIDPGAADIAWEGYVHSWKGTPP